MSRDRTGPAWVVVLIKDFETAKQRLSPALDPAQRSALARRNAEKAVAAAAAGDHVLAVTGSSSAAALASRAGAEVLLEAEPQGQNRAARRGIERALAGGAGAVLLLSSDLPLVTPRAIARLLAAGRSRGSPAVVAAAATGRGGTNALYLCPPDVIGLHFGEDSLAKFEIDARERGATFGVHRSRALALDLDEPDDLDRFSRAG